MFFQKKSWYSVLTLNLQSCYSIERKISILICISVWYESWWVQKLCYYFDKNLIKKFIWISYSHIIFSVLFAKKSKRELYFYIDYKKLNAIIVKNHYSLFLILKILNHLCKTRIYIKLDIIHAFNHLHIQENDKKLIIFCIYFEFFKYLIIFFDFFNNSVIF